MRKLSSQRLPAAMSALFLALLVACAPATPAAPTAVPGVAAKPTEAAKPAASAVSGSTSAPTAAAPAKPAPAANPEPAGDAVVATADLGPESWDPSRSVVLMEYIPGLFFESLWLHSPPNGEPLPLLLESGTMATDALSWTLKLRSGIKFSNGDAMTSEDVKFSLQRYSADDAKNASAATLRGAFSSIDVVDPLTVKITLKQPLLQLPYLLAGKRGGEGIVLPKKYIEQVGWDTFAKAPVGSGPYKLKEARIGESILFEAVPDHWRATPRYKTVKVLKVPEEQARVALLKSGQADLGQITVASTKNLEQSGLSILEIPYGVSWRAYMFGTAADYPNNPLQKLEVRKALTLAINKQEMLNTLYDGRGEVSTWGHTPPNALGAPKGIPPTPFDQAQAKQLLQQAGYPNGFDITIIAVTGATCDAYIQDFAQALASYWSQIGVRPKVETMEFTTARPLFAGARHDPKIVGNVQLYCNSGNPIALLDLNSVYYGKAGFKVATAGDTEIEAALSSKTLDDLVRNSEAAYRKIHEAYQSLPIFYGSALWAGKKSLADLPITAGFDGLLFQLARPKA